MPDKKLTDKEIVKALECCVSEQYTCSQCPYQEIKHYDDDNGFEIMPNGKQYDDWSCERWLNVDLLDLINRLQAENERLNRELEADLILQTHKQENFDEYVNTKVLEAYKEFAERLDKASFITGYTTVFGGKDVPIRHITMANVHSILKELVGD